MGYSAFHHFFYHCVANVLYNTLLIFIVTDRDVENDDIKWWICEYNEKKTRICMKGEKLSVNNVSGDCRHHPVDQGRGARQNQTIYRGRYSKSNLIVQNLTCTVLNNNVIYMPQHTAWVEPYQSNICSIL